MEIHNISNKRSGLLASKGLSYLLVRHLFPMCLTHYCWDCGQDPIRENRAWKGGHKNKMWSSTFTEKSKSAGGAIIQNIRQSGSITTEAIKQRKGSTDLVWLVENSTGQARLPHKMHLWHPLESLPCPSNLCWWYGSEISNASLQHIARLHWHRVSIL